MPRQAESKWSWARRRGYAVLRATGLVGILALGTWAPAAGQEGAEARVTADRLNLREECGMSSPVLGVLTRDETVTVLGSELGTWIRVRNADGEEGCVSAQYLKVGPTGTAEAETMASASEELTPYGWADLTDADSASIVADIEELERELAATSDPDEQEDLRQEIAELEDDLRARQEELAEEREEAAREAREAEFAASREAAERQVREARPEERRVSRSSAWTGFYIGAHVGYGSGDEVSASNNLGTLEEDVSGADGGVQLGYLYQFNRFVIGAEADYVLSGQDGTIDLGALGFPGSSLKQEYDSYGTVRVRAGFAVGRVLVYGTGGYAYGKVGTEVSGPIAAVVPNRSTSLDGWSAGAGSEIGVANRISLKGEVLVHSFDDVPEENFEDGEFFVARVGLNWRF